MPQERSADVRQPDSLSDAYGRDWFFIHSQGYDAGRFTAQRKSLLNITYTIEKQSRVVTHVITVLLAGAAVACRYVIPPQFSVAFVFLLPISFATWFGSWIAGILIALAGAAFLFLFDLQLMPGQAAAYWNGIMNAALGIVFVYIFTELRSLYHKQLSLSHRDSLTGVLNRRAFIEVLTAENRRMTRHARPVTIAYVDIDDFKEINDEFGHAAGDQCLVDVSQQIGCRLRQTDYLARIGGDEFAILLPETDHVPAQLVLSDIHHSLQQLGGEKYSATASVGAVTFRSPGIVDEMIAAADDAMYQVKQSGKNNLACKLIA